MRCWGAVGETPVWNELRAAIAAAEDEADLAYLRGELPSALSRALDGLERISTIVRSMKQFARPDQKEMTLVDLNDAVRSTLTIAAHEYKLVADVELDLQLCDQVTCQPGQVNQVILNLIVNAAHAIGEKVKDSGERGTIAVHTERSGDYALLSIGDTGGGIPKEVEHRIFDPFFTTKEVGRGTGQGLTISRNIVEKHGGRLTFDTEVGRGTTFHVWLPLQGRSNSARTAA
jgi:two-component system, NtrC family, sensor kinase